MNEAQLSSVGRKHLHLIECDPDETIVYEIRKHPFGLVGIYAIGLFITAVIFGATLGALTLLEGDKLGLGSDLSFVRPVAALLGGLLSIFTLIMTGINAYLYQSNVVYVTTHKIAQVLYRSLFDRKVSQLSIGDVQDVTTTRRGIFANLFDYGTLVIETAGEQSNYTFTFTPNPYEATRTIVEAHEENLKLYGN